MAYKARYVFPVAGPPIADGVVTVLGRSLLGVGSQALGCAPRDLGNVAILPGLVNAHTHLDLSGSREPLGRAGMPFAEWLRLVIQRRRERPPSQPAATPAGLEECTRRGVTAVADIATSGWSPRPLEQAPLRALVFRELIGLDAASVEGNLRAAREHLAIPAGSNWRGGLSPHAPYTVHPDLLAGAIAISRAKGVRLAMHLAESPEEIELVRCQTGPLVELLCDMGAWHPSAMARTLRPLYFLQALSRGHRALVIHGNYLDDEEIEFLAESSRQLTVVYCPRTHAYFGHAPHPLPRLLAAGASVAVGTDSRASNPDLSVLAELRWIAGHYPQIAPDVVLELGTVRAASALGWLAQGSLSGGSADMAVVALPERAARDPYELLFDSDLPVVATLFQGRVVYADASLGL